jgi:7-cyano-7-deazaguanine synthase
VTAPSRTSAVVLLSGGLDSAVALACARAAGHACLAISFDYGQRHRHELTAAARVAASLGVPPERHRTVTIDLRAIGGSALTDDHIDVPKDRSPAEMARHSVPPTYVPARNLIFLSFAAAFAETRGARDIYAGMNAVDYSGYPDCREPFIRAFAHAATLGTKAGAEDGLAFRVHTPLLQLSKHHIIRKGAELGVDFSLTHSCYDPVVRDSKALACGHCDSCLIRAKGFRDSGVPDPTAYA